MKCSYCERDSVDSFISHDGKIVLSFCDSSDDNGFGSHAFRAASEFHCEIVLRNQNFENRLYCNYCYEETHIHGCVSRCNNKEFTKTFCLASDLTKKHINQFKEHCYKGEVFKC